jgi:hypothetical protein
MNVTDNARKKALLLHLGGEVVFEISSGLVIDPIPADADVNVINEYTAARKTLNDYFNPKKNLGFERYTFHTTKQSASENIDSTPMPHSTSHACKIL